MNKKKVVLTDGLTVTKCYKTSDGEMFEDFDEAKTHQLRLNFCENLGQHFEDLSSNEFATVQDAIMEDLDGLTEIFQDYITMKGR